MMGQTAPVEVAEEVLALRRFDVVAQLARELEARRLAAASTMRGQYLRS